MPSHVQLRGVETNYGVETEANYGVEIGNETRAMEWRMGMGTPAERRLGTRLATLCKQVLVEQLLL